MLSFAITLVRDTSYWDRSGWRAKGSLQRAAIVRTTDVNRSKMYAAIFYVG